MIAAIEIVLIILLIGIGYIGSCFYLKGIKWKNFDLRECSLNKTRIGYLGFATVIGAYLLYCFYFVREISVSNQIGTICLVYTLLPAATVDFKVKKIPNQFLLVSLIVRLVLYIIEFSIDIPSAFFGVKEDILGAGIMGIFFFLIFLIFKNSIGMGDIKLFALMGLYQGLSGVINSIFFSLIASFFVSIVLLVTKKKSRSDTIPFGPCILLGTLMAIRLTGM